MSDESILRREVYAISSVLERALCGVEVHQPTRASPLRLSSQPPVGV